MNATATLWLLSGLLALAPGQVSEEVRAGPGQWEAGDAPRLLYQLEGHTYERRALDEEGKLTSHQRIEVGTLNPSDSHHVLPIRFVVYDTEAGSPESPVVNKRVDMELSHDRSRSGLVMNVLAFLGKADKELRIRVEARGRLYPDEPEEGERLPHLRFDIRLEQGALSILGGRTQVSMRNRRVRTRGVYETLPDAYEIESDVEVKFYLLGIRWKRRLYHSTQLLAPDHGLLREALVARGGARQVIQALDVEGQPGG